MAIVFQHLHAITDKSAIETQQSSGAPVKDSLTLLTVTVVI